MSSGRPEIDPRTSTLLRVLALGWTLTEAAERMTRARMAMSTAEVRERLTTICELLRRDPQLAPPAAAGFDKAYRSLVLQTRMTGMDQDDQDALRGDFRARPHLPLPELGHDELAQLAIDALRDIEEGEAIPGVREEEPMRLALRYAEARAHQVEALDALERIDSTVSPLHRHSGRQTAQSSTPSSSTEWPEE